jgi:hypothetical protein
MQRLQIPTIFMTAVIVVVGLYLLTKVVAIF